MEYVSIIRDLINALGKPGYSSHDEERLRNMMRDMMRENSNNSEDKRTVQRMTQLLERCIEQQHAGRQPVVQDQNNLALKVDELSRKIDMLSREPVSNPSAGVHMKMELIRLLDDLKKRPRQSQDSTSSQGDRLPWSADMKKAGYKGKEQSGGAHRKFDRETKHHNQSEKFEFVQHKDCRPQGPHSGPQYHRGPNQDHSAQNKAFQRGANHSRPSHMKDQITGSGFQQFPHYGGFQQFPSFGGSTYQGANQPQPENRQGRQQYGARGGMQMGHQSRGGIQHHGSGFGRASGHNFGSRDNINQNLSQQFGNMQVTHDTTGQPRHNSGGQGLHRGFTHQRGQSKGQGWPGRGQFQGKGNFNPKRDTHNHAQKKDQLKKSDQNSLTPKEMEVLKEIYLQHQKQQQIGKKNEGDGVEQASGNTQFKKKKRQKRKSAAPSVNKVSNESENKDEDKSDTDSDDDDDNNHSDKDTEDTEVETATAYMTAVESENEGEAAYVSPDKNAEDTEVETATAYMTAVESEGVGAAAYVSPDKDAEDTEVETATAYMTAVESEGVGAAAYVSPDKDAEDTEVGTATAVESVSEGAAAYVSPSKEAAKSSTDSKPIELLLASGFDIAGAKGVNPNQEIKDVVMIAAKQDGIETFHPSTVQEMMDFNLKYMCFIKFSAKMKANLSSLPPTKDAALHHSCRVFLQVQQWFGNESLEPERWGWTRGDGGYLTPIKTKAHIAPDSVLNSIFCHCAKGCGMRCGCRHPLLTCLWQLPRCLH